MDLLKRKIANQQASVLVELALILPIILVVTLTVFEFTRALQHLTVATSASKELANIVMRECDEGDSACLSAQRASFEQYLQTITPGTSLHVTQIIFDAAPAGIHNIIATPQSLSTNIGIPASKVSQLINKLNNVTTNGSNLTQFSDLNRNRIIVFAECYIPFSPLIVFLDSLFTLPFVNGSYLYDATII